ncbi:TonB-dependent receptor plug domain-containing protein [Sphingomonas nostoxanthinifaciens]|uniref:TonB-dependent receptor plug domain-containing protein n=1 Tax=Sphingomonas nostoxanthinifaciens TaxID=2872652 RepID=UPI001CC1D74A|nr:TonB-dependent receptor [Sphingomonas nostoxanthinifaciens]UAK26307.1 TonB-dependent receptor [Sphingomonas nostoxanthinifaciens]
MIDGFHSFRRSLGGCAALAALTTGLIAAPASAQGVPLGGQAQESVPNTGGTGAPSAPETNGEIVVTGSRIARPDLVASSPVAVINPAAIRASNTVTVEQILTVNPQFVANGTSASNNPGDGAATIDLRGLGANRTLVLIDGKRAPAYDTTGAVDVNTIPVALIKRIDVLTGGASAVYGSDAIAGVVNFVLDDEFTGLRADASNQVSGQGDGMTRDFSLTGGMKLGDRGNIVASANYSKRAGVFYSARPHNANAVSSSDLQTSAGSSNANPTVFDLGDGSEVQVTPTGALTPNLNLYNFTPVNYAQLPFERYSGTVMGKYKLTDGIEAYARGTYEHVKVVTTLAPTATAGYTFNIDPSNPFLTADERTAFFGPGAVINDGSGVADDPTARAGTSVIGIRRRVTETGGRVEDHTTNYYQGVAGLRGDLGSWKWDVSGQYGEVRRHEVLKNDLSYSALAQALDVVSGPNGAQCFDPTGGCVPLNLFNAGTIPANQLAFVLRNAVQDTKTTQIVAGGNIAGDVGFLQSPFADKPAAVSIGVEYRREKAVTTVSDDYASGDLIYYGQGQNIGGKYDTKEAYIEAKMPIVQDRPFIHALDVEGGFRYSDYSTVGAVYTYKGGGDYSPVDGLRFRGIYQRAVRAPNVYELYSPVVGGTGSLNNDPCTGNNVSSTIRAICIAQGAPASAFNGAVSSVPNPISGQINVFTGGNPNLKAEKTDTFTVGMVVNPVRFRAFTLSVDYYNIRIGNAVSVVPPSITVNQCYNVDQNAASAACSGIHRNTLNGSLSGNLIYGVPEVLGNVAVIKTDGIDVSVGYHGGNMDRFNYALSFSGTYVRNYKQQSDPTSATIQCAGKFGSACNPLEPLPKWKHVADLNLGYGSFNLLSRWRFLGAVHEDVGTDILRSRIPTISYFDETASVTVNKNLDFRLGIQNMFNKKSPIVGDTVGSDVNAGSTFPNTYDVIGRTFFAGVSVKI